ncbi:MAG: hypothetical protein V1929_05275 [bacterium]
MTALRNKLKECVFTVARLAGATAFSHSRYRGCLRILAYHGVDAVDDEAVNF